MTHPIWLFLDFDNTMMGTEAFALPSLIARFNDIYAGKLSTPLTLETFKANFHGQAREILCENLSKFYGFTVDYPVLFKDREWFMMRHYQSLDSGVPIALNLIDTLSSLKVEGYKLAFVSNNPVQRALAAMRYASCRRGDELAALFGTNYFEAGDIQKPDPTVYLRAMEQIGASPDNSFAFEDSFSGTQSAVAAGIKTLGYTGFSSEPEKLDAVLRSNGCIDTFHDWADAPQLLRKYQTATPKVA